MEGVWIDVVAGSLTLGLYAICERIWARWLPWWQRGLSCLPLVLKVVLAGTSLAIGDNRWPLARLALGLTAIGLWCWNFWTSRRNRRDGNDQRKIEASRSERLTDVQAAAFRRQATEAA